MNFFLHFTILAVIGLAAAIQVPDSATQGPNPQDIATPEPEYIDIDEPLPAAAPAAPAIQQRIANIAPAPATQQRTFAPVPAIQQRTFAPVPRPIQRPIVSAASSSYGQLPNLQYLAPQRQQQSYQPAHQNQLPGHSFNSRSGYQYRRPVYVRRAVYRRQY